MMSDDPISSRDAEGERAATRAVGPRARKRLDALRQLQALVKARGIDVAAWEREVRATRDASGRKRLSVFDDLS